MNFKESRILVDDFLFSATPEIVARLFCEMDSEGQARFFNEVAKISSVWGKGGLVMQLQYITDDDGLTLSGRRVMQYIGDYSHWGLIKCFYS